MPPRLRRAEFDVSTELEAGMYAIPCAGELPTVWMSCWLPSAYQVAGKNDPAFAIFVVYPQAGLVEVLPQNWITR